MDKRMTFTFALMDAPFEASRTTSALRIIDAALERGINIRVFAYEGAVMLPFRHQQQHANAVHGHDVEAEDHPLPCQWIAALMTKAARAGATFDWVNCGLCVDERGASDAIDGVRRGAPADFWKMAAESDATLVVATS